MSIFDILFRRKRGRSVVAERDDSFLNSFASGTVGSSDDGPSSPQVTDDFASQAFDGGQSDGAGASGGWDTGGSDSGGGDGGGGDGGGGGGD